MVTATLPEVRPAGSGTDDLAHYVCCDPKLGFCGAPVEGIDATDDDLVCVVCDEMFYTDAPCGAAFCRLREWLRRDRSWPW